MNEVEYPENEVAEIVISTFHAIIEDEQRKVLKSTTRTSVKRQWIVMQRIFQKHS